MSKKLEGFQDQEVIPDVLPTHKLSFYCSGQDDEGSFIAYGEAEDAYFLYENGKIAVSKKDKQEWNGRVFLDPNSKEGLDAKVIANLLRERDELIHEARRNLAKELAKGDLLLEDVFIYAIERIDGHKPISHNIDGVEMYEVGGNASHTALLGVKDGRLYCGSSGDEIFLLPDNLEDVTSVEILLDMAVDNLYFIWLDRLVSEERKVILHKLEDAMEAEDYTKLEAFFNEKFGGKIRQIIEPILTKYLATGKVSSENNEIEIPIENDVYTVYLKHMVRDVTDETSVYIGRGAVFIIKKNDITKN